MRRLLLAVAAPALVPTTPTSHAASGPLPAVPVACTYGATTDPNDATGLAGVRYGAVRACPPYGP